METDNDTLIDDLRNRLRECNIRREELEARAWDAERRLRELTHALTVLATYTGESE